MKERPDTHFPFQGIDETRVVVRCLLERDGLFCVHHILGDDIFGHRDYYETPGGGIEEGEGLEDALRRECLEETGYRIKVVEELDLIIDHYNLIKRKNINHFFYAQAEGEFQGRHLVSEGDSLIHETLWLPLNEIIALYENQTSAPIADLVKERELPIWIALQDKLLAGAR